MLDIFLADGAAASAIDHSHSLSSLDSATGGGRLAPLLRCPVCALLTEQLRCTQTAATRSAPLSPPQAAVASLPIPNTEVKHMYADNTWRATAREDR